MRIDLTSLAFGYRLREGASTPNWATALGQGREHKINIDPTIDEVLKGMVYSSVALSNITTKIGKGGRMVKGDDPDSPMILAALFSKVYINKTLIDSGKFILLITRDTSASHAGRLRLKYGPSNTYTANGSVFSNQGFFDRARRQLGLAADACWFISDISITNQDELHLKAIIIDANGTAEYPNNAVLITAWKAAVEEANAQDEAEHPLKTGENVILYGVPGCGKSHEIKESYCDEQCYMERVVFHPDYTYSDFVGQIMPQSTEDNEGNKHISYPFIPGPFTRIMQKAVHNPKHNYYLIIEELNRGNAPAIFGEVFQLLDRTNGLSDYGINNTDIALEVYGDAECPVKIPANLFILATMNTADQNVFTLDTAFKRRWRMRSISNDISRCKFANYPICGSDISWKAFLETINGLIVDLGDGNIGNEDKRLGAFFMQKEELADKDRFSEKVLMYLWNDAFKFDHEKIFKAEYKTLESLIAAFKEKGFDIFAENVEFDRIVVRSTIANE